MHLLRSYQVCTCFGVTRLAPASGLPGLHLLRSYQVCTCFEVTRLAPASELPGLHLLRKYQACTCFGVTRFACASEVPGLHLLRSYQACTCFELPVLPAQFISAANCAPNKKKFCFLSRIHTKAVIVVIWCWCVCDEINLHAYAGLCCSKFKTNRSLESASILTTESQSVCSHKLNVPTFSAPMSGSI